MPRRAGLRRRRRRRTCREGQDHAAGAARLTSTPVLPDVPAPTRPVATTARRVGTFVLLVVVGALLAFARNPDAILSPTLFTEDGVWIGNLHFRSLAENYLHTRPDYFVVGNLLLLHAASALFEVVGPSNPDLLPIFAACGSLLVFGLATAVGFSALRRRMPPSYAAAVLLLVAMVPVGSARSASEIWGRVSNVGFEFSVLALMLLLLRTSLEAEGARARPLLVDALLVLACATNPIAIAFVGLFFASRLAGGLRVVRRSDLPLLCLVGTIGVCVVFGVLSTERSAGPSAATFHGFVLTAVARSFLYPFLFPVHAGLDDATAVLAALPFAALLAAGFAASRRRREFGFVLACLAVQNLAVALQRPELAVDLGGYAAAYPGRYFYAQGMLAIVAVMWAAWEISARTAFPKTAAATVACGLLGFYAFQHDHVFLSRQVRCEDVPPDLASQIARAEIDPVRGDRLIVGICPPGWRMELPLDHRRP